jgi:hypothetical protein
MQLNSHKTNGVRSLLGLVGALPMYTHVDTYQDARTWQIHVVSLRMLADGRSCIWFDAYIVQSRETVPKCGLRDAWRHALGYITTQVK